jgi:hypothetical protein
VLLVGLSGLALCAARGAAPALRDAALALEPAALAGLRGLARENAWSVLLVLAPFLFHRAARLGTAAERAWLAPTPASPLCLSAALALGSLLATGLATAWTAFAAELAAGDAGTGWRRAARLESPPAVLSDDLPLHSWRLRAPAGGERLRLSVAAAPSSGPAVSARATARGGSGETGAEARVSGRTVLELALPSGGGELAVALERVGPGALLVLPRDALEVLERVPSEHLAALALGLHVWTTLGLGCLLATALARWLRPSIGAFLSCALLWLAAGAGSGPPAALARAFGELAAGLVPRAPGPAELALAAGTALVAWLADAARGGRA